MRDVAFKVVLARVRRRYHWATPPAAPVTLRSAQPVTPGPEPMPADAGGEPFPARVLLVSRDRRFRTVASVLLSQQGYVVVVSRHEDDVAERAEREGVDVVLIDASASLTAVAREAARLGSLHPPIGIVAVSTEDQTSLAALPVLDKWNSFDAVVRAIDHARTVPRRERVTSDAA